MNAIIREIITSETLQELPLKSRCQREVTSKEIAYKGVCYNKNSYNSQSCHLLRTLNSWSEVKKRFKRLKQLSWVTKISTAKDFSIRGTNNGFDGESSYQLFNAVIVYRFSFMSVLKTFFKASKGLWKQKSSNLRNNYIPCS